MDRFLNYIGGEWVEAASGERYESRNPANLTDVLWTLALSGPEDARRAVESARAAAPAWGRMPPPTRGAILDQASRILEARTEEIARTLTREEGKILAESRGEVVRARDILRYYAGEGWRLGGSVYPSNTGGELLYSRREPLGLSHHHALEFPIAIPAWKIVSPWVHGNTVVFKPAEHGEGTALALVRSW
jgi:aldehyde dehydrogenase (NAD+)